MFNTRLVTALVLLAGFIVALFVLPGPLWGILMLAALAVLGHEDIHQMNGLKNLLAVFLNAVAAGYFILAGMVRAPDAVIMAIGATIGGVAAAGVARRMGRKAVRRAVIVIGFSMALAMFVRL